MTKKATFKDFFNSHAYSGDGNSVLAKVVAAVSASEAGEAFMEINAAADEAEQVAAKLRVAVEEKFRVVVRKLEEAVTAAADQLGDDFDAATEAIGEIVAGYAYENGLEHDYSFAGDMELWEASTC